MLEQWNAAVRLIESRLDGEIEVAELAMVALTSAYHFRRVFSALAGMSLSEYIRRRRLTHAAAEIVDGQAVLDVAIRYGYGSGDSFSRAFKAMHGITPSDARRPGATLRSQPRLAFHLTVHGGSTMRHRIIELGPFRIVGKTGRIPLKYEGDNSAIADFEASIPEGTDDRLLGLANIGELSGILSASSNFEEGREDGSLFDYHHSVATDRSADELPDDVDVLEVAASTCVVFEAEDRTGHLTKALQNLWAESFGEWFPSNPYRIVRGPEILSVSAVSGGASGRGALWLPIERE